MFLFYSLMCRNYQEYKRKPCWSRIGTFLKSVWELFTKIASLTLEDDVIWRPGCYESCHNFPYEDFKPEISPIGVRTRPVGPFWWNPKRGWRKSESLYKEENPRSWEAAKTTNFPPPRQPSGGGEPPPHHPHHQGQPPRAATAAVGCCGSPPPLRAAPLHQPLHLLQRLLHRLHDEGGVVHPLDLGFVVVTWSNLSMYDHCWSPYDVLCISMDLSM